jgi:hydantoinase/carbamoylase family amidase
MSVARDPMQEPEASVTMTKPILASTGREMMARLETLATFTETPGAGLTRTYLTPTLRQAGEQLIAWMEAAGMTASFDAIGNVVAQYAGTDAKAPSLVLGSHYDTVRNAGKYDGPYGIVAALAVVETLHAQKRCLPFPIEIIAFGDEEGVRFKSTLIGSRAVAGTLDPAMLDLEDADGISVRKALAAFGGDAKKLASVARKRGQLRGYIELHIEQGPVLTAEKLPVGIVTSIAGASRFMITLTGEAGHAGTVPMSLRRDAAAAAAEFILAVEARCAAEATLVGTVGMVATPGGAANVIPGVVELSLDVRAGMDKIRKAAVRDLKRSLSEICKRRTIKAAVHQTHEARAVACDSSLMHALSASVTDAGLRPFAMASGAGHDAMAIADICPVAMLFVRCGNGGISHDPREIMTATDAEIGTRVLLGAVEKLARAQ